MKRKLTSTLALFLTMILLFSQVAYAKSNGKSGDDHGNKPEFVKLKHLDKFTEIDGKKIRINNTQHEFDTPPVIKEGRTLIPVRALTEALGCTVNWYSPRAFVTSPDGSKVILFNLETGKIYVVTGWNFGDFATFKNDAALTSFEVTGVTPPGLHDNRTYVPLRFIAETLGLKVFYDDKNGNIDIENSPSLSPASFTKDTFGTLSDIVVTLKTEGYTFVGVDGLALTTQYTVTGDSTVTLLKSYLDTITASETKLNFRFNKGDDTVLREFVIKLNYLKDQPSLSKSSTSFDFYDTVKADSVSFTLKDFELVKIYNNVTPSINLTEGDAPTGNYKLATDKKSIVFSANYLNSLAIGDHVLKFEFKQGTRVVTLTYTITVRHDQPTVVPVINETTGGYSVYNDASIVFNIGYLGYTLNAVYLRGAAIDFSADTLLVATTLEAEPKDYLVEVVSVPLNTGKVTINKSYLLTLTQSETPYTIRFEFKKGDHTINVERKIQVPVL